MKILINYYHPICADLAFSFAKLGHDVDVCFLTTKTDHYGNWKDMPQKVSEQYSDIFSKTLIKFNCITHQQAMVFLKSKRYNLLGCDGVTDGDSDLMQIADSVKIPYFNINGYPYQADEKAKNILCFSWFLPQIQYLQTYQGENGVKNMDWKNIAETGKSAGKNILVFYPETALVKHIRDSLSPVPVSEKRGFVSFVQLYEKYNHFNYIAFKNLQKLCTDSLENYGGLTQMEVRELMNSAKATVHLKHADCPPTAVLEGMLFGLVPHVMTSFIKASANQDLLIDGYSCIACDSIDEMAKNLNENKWEKISETTQRHAEMLTSLYRQKDKLQKFLSDCLEC